MAKKTAPSHNLLTTGLSERAIPLEVQGIVNMRTSDQAAALVRLGAFKNCPGGDMERYAVRQGRGRELLVYMMERMARHVRAWRAFGFTGKVFVQLDTRELEDRTLAMSFDVIARSQHIDASSFTFVVSLADYLERQESIAPAIMRIRKAGCGVAMSIDGIRPPKFQELKDHPFTAVMIGGKDLWKRMRTAGPGKLGALGTWIGWAESEGLERTAIGISNATDETTARMFSFSLGLGSHYSDYVPARSFIEETKVAEGPAEIALHNWVKHAIASVQPQPGLELKRA